MNPNSHSSCTSLSQNVTRSLESNFQIGSHITIGQETFRGGSGRGTRSEGWHGAQFPGVPALKEPARAAGRGRTEGTCWRRGGGGGGRGEEGWQAKPNAGQEAHCFPLPSVSFAMTGCVGSLCDMQPRRVTPETLRASLGTFSPMPQFPSCSSAMKQLVILSCYSIVKNYIIIMESPKLQWERSNIGTYNAKMRTEGTPGRGMAALTRKELCLPLTLRCA